MYAIYLYICICICIWRERERERKTIFVASALALAVFDKSSVLRRLESALLPDYMNTATIRFFSQSR